MNDAPIVPEPRPHPGTTRGDTAPSGVSADAIGSGAVPMGAAVGREAGGDPGGRAGNGALAAIGASGELEHWRRAYSASRHSRNDLAFAAYEPAYRYGWETWWENRAGNSDFYDAEPILAYSWQDRRGTSTLTWIEARQAVKDVWSRLESRFGRRGSALNEVRSTVEVLNSLVETCRQCAWGFRIAAERIHDEHAALLTRFASEREGFAAELRVEVRALGGTPVPENGLGGSRHRGQIGFGVAVASGPRAIIAVCVRAEDTAVEAYRAALEKPDLTPGARALISGQHLEVKAAHGRVAGLHRALG